MSAQTKHELEPDVIIKGRARFDLADASLKQWAKDYQGCKKEIERLTGSPYSPPTKRSGFVSSDELNNYRSEYGFDSKQSKHIQPSSDYGSKRY